MLEAQYGIYTFVMLSLNVAKKKANMLKHEMKNYWDVSEWPPSRPLEQISHSLLLAFRHTARHCIGHWTPLHTGIVHCNVDATLHTIDCTFHTEHCNLMSTLLNAPSMGHHSIELMPLSCTTLAHCKVYTTSNATLPSMQMRCTMK